MGKSLPPLVLRQVLDPEALAAAVRNADLTTCQISKKPVPSRLARVMCPQVCLDFASFGPAMLFSGIMPRDCYTLVFVLECPEAGHSFNFGSKHRDGYMGFFPPGGLLDAYTPEGCAELTLTVPAAVFLTAVEKSFPEIPEKILQRGAGMRIGQTEQAHLRALLPLILSGTEDPASLLAEEGARKNLGSSVLDVFLMALRAGCSSLVKEPGQRVEKRLRHLRLARDYLVEHQTHPVQITELSSEIGLTRRGVESLFRDTMGVGPITLLRHQRLHGARRALGAAPNKLGKVKETALEWGFWHMGHFAKEYREFFGESPSETLERLEQ